MLTVISLIAFGLVLLALMAYFELDDRREKIVRKERAAKEKASLRPNEWIDAMYCKECGFWGSVVRKKGQRASCVICPKCGVRGQLKPNAWL